MFTSLKETKAHSDGNVDFLKKLGEMWTRSIFFKILRVAILAIPISMIVMGAIYFDDCDAESMIPIYLVVSGTVTTVCSLLTFLSEWMKKEGDPKSKLDYFLNFSDMFLFAWFIAGCVFIYRTKGDFQSDDIKLPEFCDYTFYWYSFWITTSVFMIMGFAIFVVLCLFLFAACL